MKLFSVLRALCQASLLSVSLLPAVHAADMPFSQPAFDSAIAAGKPVVVEFYDPACSTCREQRQKVVILMKDAKLSPVTVFIADFTKEKALKKSLKVNQQSTLIAFKGGVEATRSTGQTDQTKLAELIALAL